VSMLVHSDQMHTFFDFSADDGPKLRGRMDQSISNKPLNNLVVLPLWPHVIHLAQRFSKLDGAPSMLATLLQASPCRSMHLAEPDLLRPGFAPV